MKCPKSVKIGSHIIKILYRNSIKEDNDMCLGLADVDDNKIYIKKGLPESKKEEVLLHECIHFMDENFCLKLGEKKVSILSTLLVEFFRDNKIRL